jgi:hypothetical protein
MPAFLASRLTERGLNSGRLGNEHTTAVFALRNAG